MTSTGCLFRFFFAFRNGNCVRYSLVSGAQRLLVDGDVFEARRAARPVVDESSVGVVGTEAALEHEILAIACVD